MPPVTALIHPALMLICFIAPMAFAAYAVLSRLGVGLGHAGKPMILGGIIFAISCPVPVLVFGFLLGAESLLGGILVATWWFFSGCGLCVIGVLLKIAYAGVR